MQAAKRVRDNSLVALKEAIRQANRYTQNPASSARIIAKKILKVEEACESYKTAQYVYCHAAEIDMNADEHKAEKDAFCAQIDQAIDCCDDGTLLIDEKETQEAAALQGNQSVAQAAQAEESTKTKMAQLLNLFKADKELVTNLMNKAQVIIDKNETTEANAAHLKTYDETLHQMYESLSQSWKDLITTVPAAELDALTNEHKINETKANIHESISAIASFIEKCKPKSSSQQEAAPTAETGKKMMLRTQKASYPTFGGDIRNFARFQREFKTIVVPAHTDPSHQAYVLKTECLKDSVRKCVENIDDVTEIWKRLEDKYGNKHDLVDVVVKDLGKVQKLKQNDDVKFISLVDMIEKGLQDLSAIDAQHELANSYTVTRVEAKLSRETYHEWLKEEENLEGESRFEKLFSFLKDERRRVEKIVQRSPHVTTDPGKENKKPPWKKEHCNLTGGQPSSGGGGDEVINQCLVHPTAKHFTRKCRGFMKMSDEERVTLVQTTNACPLCLSIKHIGSTCPFKTQWGPCGIDACGLHHARALHKAIVVKQIGTELCAAVTSIVGVEFNTLLLVQEIPSTNGSIKSMFDNGSTISLISKSFVLRHQLKGLRVAFDLITVGGTSTTQYSYLHLISLIDAQGEQHVIKAYQIDEICGEMKGTDLGKAAQLFHDLSPSDVERENGHIELLIGAKHLSVHPDKIETVENLVLYKSIFGTQRILSGTHPSIGGESDTIASTVQRVAHAQTKNIRVMCQKDLDPGIDFFTQESFGVQVIPSCEDCINCEKCNKKVHQMSKVEQQELKIIEENLVLDPDEECWTTPYPYKESPSVLQDNREQALKFMQKTEARLNKSETKAAQFREQFDDYVKRGVFRKLSDEEMAAHTGPVFYVTYHEVEKEDSTSTPLRIVMNSSLKYKGKSLNDILMKGPNTLNDLFTIQLKFRCHIVPMILDIKKMYHSIKTTDQELHLRRIAYRDLDPSKPVETYGITRVNFGDRSAAAIASVALQKTAKLHENINKEAAQKIRDESFVDDVVTGGDNDEEFQSLKKHIPEILAKGNFHPKGITTVGDTTEESLALLGSGEYGRVLGIQWDPQNDILLVKVRINFSKKERKVRTGEDLSLKDIPSIVTIKLTRRLLLSVVNSCYDPYGLLTPLTVQMKIQLRNLHGKEANLKWDDPLSHEMKLQWIEILTRIKQAEVVTFTRCIKPLNTLGKPSLILCSDGSTDAMCATAHIRWECEEEVVHCQLWASKTRVTPLKKMTIP